ncbi:MAG: 30S ribosomal protein S4 [Verrucomicrobiota bacterium]|nr:30S ribosomal protein S4 [Verrucomicrobiota bacterium]
MGRYTGPACRSCRREGMKLFLKGARCGMAKCPIETGRPAPGMHGAMRRRKLSDYGAQLREKQRLRRQYGLQEGQFRVFFQRALRRRGVTGEQLLQSLEMRLDNIVFRLGLAPSRRAARQLVTHSHVLVNGHRATIPSMILLPGMVVAVKDRARSRDMATRGIETAESRPVPPWLTLDAKKLSAQVARVPTRDEIAPIVNEQLIVELYSK